MADNQNNQNQAPSLPSEVNSEGISATRSVQDRLMSQVIGAIDRFTQSEEATQAVSRPAPQNAQQATQPPSAPRADEKGPIPYDRFAEVTAAKNAAIAEAAALRERNARLEAEARAAQAAIKASERLAADPTLKDSEGRPEIDPKTIRVAQVVAEESIKEALGVSPQELRSLLAERQVSRDLGGSVNAQQAQAIASICQQTGLSPSEAVLVAATRNPSLFPAQDARGPSPTVHHQTSPSSAPQPKNTEQPRSKQILDSLRGVPHTANGFNELAGEALFDRIGQYFGAQPRT